MVFDCLFTPGKVSRLWINLKEHTKILPQKSTLYILKKCKMCLFLQKSSTQGEGPMGDFRSCQVVCKLLKMSHLKFSILALSTNFCPIKVDLSGNTA